jgi:hypothetical protein
MLTCLAEYSQAPHALKVDKKSGVRFCGLRFFVGEGLGDYISAVSRVSCMHRTPNRLIAAAIET